MCWFWFSFWYLFINMVKRKVRGICICMNLRFFIRLMKIVCKFVYRLSNFSEIIILVWLLYCKINIMINDGLFVFWFIIIRY